MATLLISYDLSGPERDYGPLIDGIKQLGAWWHHLDSTWLVNTNLTPVQLRDKLMPYLRTGDELLVMDVTGRPRAWTGFAQRGSDWLKDTFH